ncbi:50S ribosomal protein L11 methyltransferase [Phormidium tenue FACHB-886]|nr:50S ribosomal protein L11 methyltransferase [Phormidium tenue FACHB-886]
MPWRELSFNATPEAIDWVRVLLASTNYTDEIQIANCPEPLQWSFTVALYFPEAAQRQLETVADRLTSLHRAEQISAPQLAVVEERASTAAAPLIHRVGDRFVILAPAASYRAKATEISLQLCGTHSFGSGFHPATMLSLRLIERHILPQIRTLDLGCGSGILSVAMAKLGAQVLALDNDPIAVQATQDAVERNHVASQVVVQQGSLGYGNELGHWMGEALSSVTKTIVPQVTVDAVVANILGRIHIALAADYYNALQQTAGLLITAGYSTDYEDEVKAALTAAGFQMIDCERLNDWVALVHRVG